MPYLPCEPSVGLVTAILCHALVVGESWERCSYCPSLRRPRVLQHVLHQRDDALRVHKGHLKVNLREKKKKKRTRSTIKKSCLQGKRNEQISKKHSSQYHRFCSVSVMFNPRSDLPQCFICCIFYCSNWELFPWEIQSTFLE